MTEKIRRQDLWRQNYLIRPYLQDTSNDELIQRFRDINKNIMTLTPEGKIGVIHSGPEAHLWWERVTHIQEEFGRRGGLPQNMLQQGDLPQSTAPALPKAVIALHGLVPPAPGTALIKLGKQEHMHSMYKEGKIRISPASSYTDPSLNAAIHDDELSISSIGLRSEMTMTVIDKETGKSKGKIKPIGNTTIKSEMGTDYFVYCLAHTLDIRLFDDFEADACVIIRNPTEFQGRLLNAVKAHLPAWTDWDQSVQYLDPYNSSPNDHQVSTGKHFRYSYQKEYRFVWLPPSVENQMEPFFVEIGTLSDIAELVTL